MTIFTGTNKGRVDKITEIVGHLQKSVNANKPTPDEVWQLLQPAIDSISALCGAEAQQPDRAEAPEAPAVQEPSQPDVPGGAWADKHHPARWATIHDMAAQAPLDELTIAMRVYLNRIEEELETTRD